MLGLSNELIDQPASLLAFKNARHHSHPSRSHNLTKVQIFAAHRAVLLLFCLNSFTPSQIEAKPTTLGESWRIYLPPSPNLQMLLIMYGLPFWESRLSVGQSDEPLALLDLPCGSPNHNATLISLLQIKENFERGEKAKQFMQPFTLSVFIVIFAFLQFFRRSLGSPVS